MLRKKIKNRCSCCDMYLNNVKNGIRYIELNGGRTSLHRKLIMLLKELDLKHHHIGGYLEIRKEENNEWTYDLFLNVTNFRDNDGVIKIGVVSSAKISTDN